MSNVIDLEAGDVKEISTSVIINNDTEVPTVNDPTLPTGLVFATTRNDGQQTPLLTVTNEGEFLWDENAAERLELDDFTDIESMRFVLKALWGANCPKH